MLKKIRMDWVEEDIRASVLFEEEYKEIKQMYLNATTEEEWHTAIEKHDTIVEEENKMLRDWMKALKKMKGRAVK